MLSCGVARARNLIEKLSQILPNAFGAVALFDQSAGILPQLLYE